MKTRAPIEIVFPKASGLTPPLRLACRKAIEMTLGQLPRTAWKKARLDSELTHSLALNFVSPKQMQSLNLAYRKKNKPTDVLSFSRIEGERVWSPEPEIGDVVICLAVAKKQAEEYETSLKEELQRLTVHGVLHLFGYDHETNAKDARKMFRLQNQVLKLLSNRLDRVKTRRSVRRIKRT